MKPILETIRKLLRLKQSVTITQIASYAGLPRKRVLDVLDANRQYLGIDKNGRIGKVDPQTPYLAAAYAAGRWWREETINYGTVPVLVWEGHDDLRERFQSTVICGGLGDSWPMHGVVEKMRHVEDALRAVGMVPYGEMVATDELWLEDDVQER